MMKFTKIQIAVIVAVSAVCGSAANAQPQAPTALNSSGQPVGAIPVFTMQATGQGVAPLATTAAASCLILKASAASVYSVSGYTGAAAWMMLLNSATIPADGTVQPVSVGYASAQGSWSMSFSTPAILSNGAVICTSSTGPYTKTAVATNNYMTGQVK